MTYQREELVQNPLTSWQPDRLDWFLRFRPGGPDRLYDRRRTHADSGGQGLTVGLFMLDTGSHIFPTHGPDQRRR